MVYPKTMSKQQKAVEELTKKSETELKKLLAEKRESLRDFRFSMQGSKIRNTKQGVQLRKEIARILYILGTREKATSK